MSSRYFADSSCIQQPAALIQRFQEIAVRGSALFNEIHRAPEQSLECFLQPEVLSEAIGRAGRAESHQKIDIAVRRVESACRRRAEDLEPAHSESRADNGDLGAADFDQGR